MPLWTGPLGPATDFSAAVNIAEFGPSVANGFVYVRTDRLRVFTLLN